ncbi:Uncharacterized protein Fot_35239 [Forsythia ovata]|uniref:Uncharacterized protein n=1 Tax=Forsythia ovata TaxID=205694 RepID=A0ABD1SLN6_9LAMI
MQNPPKPIESGQVNLIGLDHVFPAVMDHISRNNINVIKSWEFDKMIMRVDRAGREPNSLAYSLGGTMSEILIMKSPIRLVEHQRYKELNADVRATQNNSANFTIQDFSIQEKCRAKMHIQYTIEETTDHNYDLMTNSKFRLKLGDCVEFKGGCVGFILGVTVYYLFQGVTVYGLFPE